ncbi:MAG: hypothetical protein LBE01_01085 [Deltaproteobacteria bacterium]|jgi:hypothetical protein|nr:hypothetical protein [Deltaproteobacteria bacterium]
MAEKSRILNHIGGSGPWSKDGIISELEKIKAFSLSDGGLHLMNPLTKTQRELFAAFETNEKELRAFVGRLEL